MLNKIYFFIYIVISQISPAFGFTEQFTNRDNFERNAMIGAILLVIFSPKKKRATSIGIVGGFTFVYLSYKYVLPVIL